MNRAQRRREAKLFRRVIADPHGRFAAEQAVHQLTAAAGVRPGGMVNFEPSAWGRDDREWFAAHPQRSHRVRWMFDGETFDPSYATALAKEPDDRVIVIIKQIRPGLRARKPFILAGCSADQIATLRDLLLRGFEEEGAAHLLFDLPGKRVISPAELAGLIETYERRGGNGRVN
jgi:hypothetical protein